MSLQEQYDAAIARKNAEYNRGFHDGYEQGRRDAGRAFSSKFVQDSDVALSVTKEEVVEELVVRGRVIHTPEPAEKRYEPDSPAYLFPEEYYG